MKICDFITSYNDCNVINSCIFICSCWFYFCGEASVHKHEIFKNVQSDFKTMWKGEIVAYFEVCKMYME